MLSILIFCLSTTTDRAKSLYCHKDTLLLIRSDPLPLCSFSSSQPLLLPTPTHIQIHSTTFTFHILTTPVQRATEQRQNKFMICLALSLTDVEEKQSCWLLSLRLLRLVYSGIRIFRNWRAQSQHDAQHGDAEVDRRVIWTRQAVVLILCLCKLLNREACWFSTHPHPLLFSQERKRERQKPTINGYIVLYLSFYLISWGDQGDVSFTFVMCDTLLL